MEMDLSVIWFVLIGVLFTGFFILEGFDYGVGILLPILGKNDGERRLIINAIGPVWDGNEVWLITAGGAIFAAFPHWYASLFSAFYIPFVILLLALIIRGVSFEFRSKDRSPLWRSTWDWGAFVGSLLPAFLWGVAIANLVVGIPLNENMHYVGGLGDLLKPYALVGGFAAVLVFTVHGAMFLALKVGDDIGPRALRLAVLLAPATLLVLACAALAAAFSGDFVNQAGFWLLVCLAAAGFVAIFLTTRAGKPGWGFFLTTVIILASVIAVFFRLFPHVLISNIDPAWSITIDAASSSPKTLQIMTVVAVIFLPLVLLYQGWTYWIFRKRLTARSKLEY